MAIILTKIMTVCFLNTVFKIGHTCPFLHSLHKVQQMNVLLGHTCISTCLITRTTWWTSI